MRSVALIGYGAMAHYVSLHLKRSPWRVSNCVIRQGRESAARDAVGEGIAFVRHADEINKLPDLVVDCAGHLGLQAHGAAFLRKGVPLISASLGALADEKTYRALEQAAQDGGTSLHLASGAIGALDALSAAKIGGLETVRYTGIKPPASWRGTPAETAANLDALGDPLIHFDGNARDAALRYPKNANVAAAVALAGVGFDLTRVRLIADPKADGNRHEITAKGGFGTFEFTINGASLPDTPRTSALAAMSVVDRILRHGAPIVF
ncbi:aspartate dehydrogenase [Octadecabacter sp. 1_MG-2023]|uniref:aspartate dehydrogenase n=1 Tax=unclassified Octadecabacter TaxID=196158 RepID=UPI001C0A6665|nr:MULTISPECIES: aspartate dehydrogenase [unclassified Octadecabacter]MBU2993574.1 aspartate dehydrogenase [Octadecabacter sp. B2R22]MDO6735582.1 aspartate dehydrogenase [Octadecabacter sp. 1_MG-2023]